MICWGSFWIGIGATAYLSGIGAFLFAGFKGPPMPAGRWWVPIAAALWLPVIIVCAIRLGIILLQSYLEMKHERKINNAA